MQQHGSWQNAWQGGSTGRAIAAQPVHQFKTYAAAACCLLIKHSVHGCNQEQVPLLAMCTPCSHVHIHPELTVTSRHGPPAASPPEDLATSTPDRTSACTMPSAGARGALLDPPVTMQLVLQ